MRQALVFLAVMAMMAGAALWNGFPLVFFDSEDYVNMAFTWDLVLWRTMPYALVAWTAKATGTLWAIIAVQALCAAWVVHEAVCAFFPQHRTKWLLGLSAALLFLTGLPWYVGQIMADAFAGLVILGIAVLAFGRDLPRWRRRLLVPVVALGIMVHMSHVAVAAGLLLCLVLLKIGGSLARFIPRPRMTLVVLAVLAGMAGVPLTHWATIGRPIFTASGHVLQLALFVQHGLVERYLEEVCPKGKRYKLCPYADDLPETADSFLWAPWRFPFFKRLGGWTGMMGEANLIVADIIRLYPEEVLGHSIEAGIQQMVSLGVGEGLTPKVKRNWAGEFLDTVANRFPAEEAAYLASRQNTGDGIRFDAINGIQLPLAVISFVVALATCLFAWRRNDMTATGLALVVLLGLLGNAVVCGALSNPHDRYQNRVAWLSFVVAAAGFARPQPFAGRKRPAKSISAGGSAPPSQASP